MRRTILPLIVLLTFVIFIVFAITADKGRTNRLDSVKCIEAEEREFRNTVFANGHLKYKIIHELGGAFDGYIEHIALQPGTRFKKGDLLFIVKDSQRLLEMFLEFEKLRTRYEFASNELASYGSIYKQGGISKNEFLNYKDNYTTAKNIFMVHPFNEYLKYLKYENGKFSFYSPFEGIVLKINYFEGERVNNTKSIASISEGNTMIAVLNVNILDSKKIMSGNDVTVTSDLLDDFKIEAKVMSVSLLPIQIYEQQIIEVFCEFETDEIFADNTPIEGRIIYQIIENALIVPIESVFESKPIFKKQQFSYTYFTYVLKDINEDSAVIEKRDVIIGDQDEFFIQIRSGLSIGEYVLTYSEKPVFNSKKVNYVIDRSKRYQ